MEKLYLIFCLFHCVYPYKYLLIRIADGTSVGQNFSLNTISQDFSLNKIRDFDMTMNRAFDRKAYGDLERGKKSNDSEFKFNLQASLGRLKKAISWTQLDSGDLSSNWAFN